MAATSTPYAGRGGVGAGCQTRCDTASRAWGCDPELGPEGGDDLGQRGLGGGRGDHAEAPRHVGGLRDVLVATGLVERSRAVGLVGQQEARSRRRAPTAGGAVGGGCRRPVVVRAAHPCGCEGTTSTACCASSAVPKVVTARNRLVRRRAALHVSLASRSARRPRSSPRRSEQHGPQPVDEHRRAPCTWVIGLLGLNHRGPGVPWIRTRCRGAVGATRPEERAPSRCRSAFTISPTVWPSSTASRGSSAASAVPLLRKRARPRASPAASPEKSPGRPGASGYVAPRARPPHPVAGQSVLVADLQPVDELLADVAAQVEQRRGVGGGHQHPHPTRPPTASVTWSTLARPFTARCARGSGPAPG